MNHTFMVNWFDPGAKTVEWAKDSIFNKMFQAQLNNNIPKSEFGPLSYTKIDSKLIKDPNVRAKV